MTETTEGAVFTGRSFDGRMTHWQLRFGDVVTVPDSILHTQRVIDDNGQTYYRRSVPKKSPVDGRRALDNEIRALARLRSSFSDDRPRPFPQLIGYDMDSENPFALVSTFRGAPAGEVVGDLLSSHRNEMVVGLFHALAHLQEVDLVHGNLTLSSVFLSGSSVQLVAFENAVLADERLVNGNGWARADDDMFAAGRLLYEVFTGVPLGSEIPDLSEVSLLDDKLRGLFVESGRRPSALTVLVGLGCADLPKPSSRNELLAGHNQFDHIRAEKWGSPPEHSRRLPDLAPAPRAASAARPRVPLTSLLVVSLVVLLAVIAYLIVGVIPR